MAQSSVRRCLFPRIIIEIQRVLTYPYVTETLHWSDPFKAKFLSDLSRRAILIPEPPLVSVYQDQNDDMYFACANAANVPYIVSKDDDMLAVEEYEGIKVVKPGYFVHRVLPTLTSKAA